jgi:hypothetical protein
MQCTLLIPNLFWPRESAASVLAGLALPALSKLVARARSQRFPAVSLEGWLCQAFEVDKQQDWPVAPLTLALDGGDPGTDYWLRADPIHLRVERDSVTLLDNTFFDIDPAESSSLIEAINAHFAPDGLVFEARAGKRWHVRAARTPQLRTTLLSDVAGRDVRDHLPTGEDAGAWHRIFNEVQMVMHGHAVNETRESNGEPPINSVWIWGGGTQPRVNGRHFDAVWTNEPLAAALAAVSDVASAVVPERSDAWLDLARTGHHARHLVVLDTLAAPAAYQDMTTWRTRLEALEAHWFMPLTERLRDGSITALAIVAPGASACWRFDAKRGDLMRFWRRGEALTQYE